MLLYRTLQVGLSNWREPRVRNVQEEFVLRFRVLPFDIDVARHMNNARYLNYMEVGRWGIALRLGLPRLIIRRQWIFPISSLRVVYLKPLRAFQRFELRTRITHWDNRWFYVEHRFIAPSSQDPSEEVLVACASVKWCVIERRRRLAPLEVLELIGLSPAAQHPADDVIGWQVANRQFLDRIISSS